MNYVQQFYSIKSLRDIFPENISFNYNGNIYKIMDILHPFLILSIDDDSKFARTIHVNGMEFNYVSKYDDSWATYVHYDPFKVHQFNLYQWVYIYDDDENIDVNAEIVQITEHGFIIDQKIDRNEISGQLFIDNALPIDINQNGEIIVDQKLYHGYRTKKEKRTEPFTLMHKTSDLENILQTKYLLRSIIDEEKNSCGYQFPGVYFKMNFGQFNQGNIWEDPQHLEIDGETEVYMEFGGDLVQRGDFHFNGIASNGRILGSFGTRKEYDGQRTYFADEFDTNVRNKGDHYNSRSTTDNEIVFHHDVSLKHLNKIHVFDEAMYYHVSNLLNESKMTRVKVRMGKLPFVMPGQLPCLQSFSKLKPNYCSCVSQIPSWANKKSKHEILLHNNVNNRIIESCALKMKQGNNMGKTTKATLLINDADSNIGKFQGIINHAKMTNITQNRLDHKLLSSYNEINENLRNDVYRTTLSNALIKNDQLIDPIPVEPFSNRNIQKRQRI